MTFLATDLTHSFCQVSIANTPTSPDTTAMLDVISTERGILIPRMTQAERMSITSPANALLLYQTDGIDGFYYNQGNAMAPNWVLINSSADNPCSGRIPIDSIPFTINAPGSYYVTQHLVSDSDDHGIIINASEVYIDLNGYSIKGINSSGKKGISVTGTLQDIKIINGFVSQWNGGGIALSSANNVLISNIASSDNGNHGIHTGSNAIILSCHASGNMQDGISSGTYAMIDNCTSSNNMADGIDCGNNSKVANSTSINNVDNGIETGLNSIIENTNSTQNGTNGFYVDAGSNIASCVASTNTENGYELKTGTIANQNISRSNLQNGFLIESDCLISNNLADNNLFSGYLVSGNDARIDNNQSTDNSQYGFQFLGSGNVAIRNSSSGNGGLSYNVGSGNAIAVIITLATLNSNNNPFANLDF